MTGAAPEFTLASKVLSLGEKVMSLTTLDLHGLMILRVKSADWMELNWPSRPLPLFSPLGDFYPTVPMI